MLTMSTSLLRCYSKNPKTGQSEEFSPTIPDHDCNKAGTGRVGVSIANMSFSIK